VRRRYHHPDKAKTTLSQLVGVRDGATSVATKGTTFLGYRRYNRYKQFRSPDKKPTPIPCGNPAIEWV
jgi:hypothetical protein